MRLSRFVVVGVLQVVVSFAAGLDLCPCFQQSIWGNLTGKTSRLNRKTCYYTLLDGWNTSATWNSVMYVCRNKSAPPNLSPHLPVVKSLVDIQHLVTLLEAQNLSSAVVTLGWQWVDKQWQAVDGSNINDSDQYIHEHLLNLKPQVLSCAFLHLSAQTNLSASIPVEIKSNITMSIGACDTTTNVTVLVCQYTCPEDVTSSSSSDSTLPPQPSSPPDPTTFAQFSSNQIGSNGTTTGQNWTVGKDTELAVEPSYEAASENNLNLVVFAGIGGGILVVVLLATFLFIGIRRKRKRKGKGKENDFPTKGKKSNEKSRPASSINACDLKDANDLRRIHDDQYQEDVSVADAESFSIEENMIVDQEETPEESRCRDIMEKAELMRILSLEQNGGAENPRRPVPQSPAQKLVIEENVELSKIAKMVQTDNKHEDVTAMSTDSSYAITPKGNPWISPKSNPYATPKSNPYGTPNSNPYGTPKSNPKGTPKSRTPMTPSGATPKYPRTPSTKACTEGHKSAQQTTIQGDVGAELFQQRDIAGVTIQ